MTDTWKSVWKLIKASWFGSLVIAFEVMMYPRAERGLVYSIFTIIIILLAVMDIINNSITLAKEEIKREQELEE